MGVFSKKPARPATVSTDEIIPFHFFDDLLYTRAIAIDCTLRFDDVMDAEKIRMALARLLEIGDWRKLGARLRLNDAGKLEYHVPQLYDEKRPGFIYTTAEHDTSINDHPLASRLPKPTDRPSVFGTPGELAPLIRRADSPTRLEDWIYTDRPQLEIHIVSFKDATLVTVTFLHTLMDAMGLRGLFKAWTAVLCGREDEVPHFHGFDQDPLRPLSETTPVEKYVHSRLIMKGLTLLLFVFRYVFEMVWHRKVEQRMICLPGRYLQSMREKALQGLAAEADSPEKPFVSESDMLLSWLSQTMLFALKPAVNRTVMFLNVFDIRPTLADDLIPSNSIYIGNATFPAYTSVRVRQVLQGPLSFVASQLRRSLERLRTREQVHALASIQKTAVEKTGHLSPVGDPSMIMIVCSSWHKARFFEVDFSAAVIAPGVPLTQRANKLGRPSYINAIGNENGISTRNVICVNGKDTAENWWLSLSLRTEAWPAVEKELRSMAIDESD